MNDTRSAELCTNKTWGVIDEDEPVLVVGVGASAGGVEALERLFTKVPSNLGFTFVVIQHLSREFESSMSEILEKRTKLPVQIIRDQIRIKKNTLYLTQAGTETILEGHTFKVRKTEDSGATQSIIDLFFKSLSKSYGPRAVGIVLSGTGRDGSQGIQSVHLRGGLVFAQSLETCQYEAMPRSAIETGKVDFIEMPINMAELLIEHLQRPTISRINKILRDKTSKLSLALFEALATESSIDFSCYKPATLSRRIERRLHLHQMNNIQDYIEFVCENPGERALLCNDLLIGVTNFFRDREAFQFLEETIIPQIVNKAIAEERGLRCWIAACSTGQEAYSIAMLLCEFVEKNCIDLDIQIFASDANNQALNIAREGVYSEQDLESLSDTRKLTFFTRLPDNRYQINPGIRGRIIFVRHNVLIDAPFTKIDLILCRNLLIYLQAEAQMKALSKFHFGLREQGTLVLGMSEDLGAAAEFFSVQDQHYKVYTSTAPRMLSLSRQGDLSKRMKLKVTRTSNIIPASTPADSKASPQIFQAYDSLLDLLLPEALLVNNEHEIVHVFGAAAEYLTFPTGRLEKGIFNIIHPELRPALQAVLLMASQRNDWAHYKTANKINTSVQTFSFRARKIYLNEKEDPWFIVCFKPTQNFSTKHNEDSVQVDELENDTYLRIAQLESALSQNQKVLQKTIKDLQKTSEEYQVSNEELMATNEELQSSNEELHTLNSEYQKKIDDYLQLNTDMKNLIETSDIAMLLLDKDLRIRKYSPQAASIVKLEEGDFGRHIETFAFALDYTELFTHIRRVNKTGESLEQEARDITKHRWYTVKILPYRSLEGKVDGVVITFVDSTRIKLAEEHTRERADELEQFVEVAVNREERIIELKQIINQLCQKLGLQDRYDMSEINRIVTSEQDTKTNGLF